MHYATQVTVFLSVALVAVTSCSNESGADLFLLRGGSGIETHRANFDYAGDCRLVADTMNEAEPDARWFCK